MMMSKNKVYPWIMTCRVDGRQYPLYELLTESEARAMEEKIEQASRIDGDLLASPEMKYLRQHAGLTLVRCSRMKPEDIDALPYWLVVGMFREILDFSLKEASSGSSSRG